METSRLSALGGRIHVGMCQNGITTVAELARRVGVSHQTARRWLYDAEYDITALDAFKLGEVLRVSARWVVTGQGHATPMMQVGPNERALLLGFRELPEDYRAALMHTLREMIHTATQPDGK